MTHFQSFVSIWLSVVVLSAGTADSATTRFWSWNQIGNHHSRMFHGLPSPSKSPQLTYSGLIKTLFMANTKLSKTGPAGITCAPLGSCELPYGTDPTHFSSFGFVSPVQYGCLYGDGVVLCVDRPDEQSTPRPTTEGTTVPWWATSSPSTPTTESTTVPWWATSTPTTPTTESTTVPWWVTNTPTTETTSVPWWSSTSKPGSWNNVVVHGAKPIFVTMNQLQNSTLNNHYYMQDGNRAPAKNSGSSSRLSWASTTPNRKLSNGGRTFTSVSPSLSSSSQPARKTVWTSASSSKTPALTRSYWWRL